MLGLYEPITTPAISEGLNKGSDIARKLAQILLDDFQIVVDLEPLEENELPERSTLLPVKERGNVYWALRILGWETKDITFGHRDHIRRQKRYTVELTGYLPNTGDSVPRLEFEDAVEAVANNISANRLLGLRVTDAYQNPKVENFPTRVAKGSPGVRFLSSKITFVTIVEDLVPKKRIFKAR